MAGGSSRLGYVNFDAGHAKFSMMREQIAVFADEHSEFCMLGGFDASPSTYMDEPKITAALIGQGSRLART